MKPEETNIYREIQRNAELSMQTIDILKDKVYEDDFALQIARQALKYSDIRNRAVDRLINAKKEPLNQNYLSDFLQKSSMEMNTLLDSSLSHIAELMIAQNNKSYTNMCKALNHNEIKQSFSIELAKELMDFEEKSMKIYRKYL